MDTEQALEIIKCLADGKDPENHELPPESLFQRPSIIRALLAARLGLERQLQFERKKLIMPGNTGRTWRSEEEIELMNGFDAGATMSQLALQLGRTTGAVKARLIKLGKIEDDGTMHRYS